MPEELITKEVAGVIADAVSKGNEAIANDLAITKKDLEATTKAFAEFRAKVEASEQGGPAKKKSPVYEAIEKNLEELKSSLSKKQGLQFEIKATPGVISTFDNTHVDAPSITGIAYKPGLVLPVRNRFNILDYLPTFTTTQQQFTWYKRVNEDGNAQFINECEVKPDADFDIVEEVSSKPKKVAVMFAVCTEWLSDIPLLASWIEQYLRELIEDEITKQILNGDGLGANLLGLIPQASAFNNPVYANRVKFANEVDAIRAIGASMQCFGCTGDLLFINCDDWYAITSIKDANGQYMQIPTLDVNNRRLGGLTVVPVPGTLIPSGSFLIVDTNKIKIAVWEGITMDWGYINDDFKKNIMRARMEARILSFMEDTTCMILDTFDNVITFIDKP